jgi:hypothetical protein
MIENHRGEEGANILMTELHLRQKYNKKKP